MGKILATDSVGYQRRLSRRVVGAVADGRQASLAEAARPGLYPPRTQVPEMPAMFAACSAGPPPLEPVSRIREELHQVDSHQAIASVRTMEEVRAASEGQRSSILLCLMRFAGTGPVLMPVGCTG